MGLQTSIEWADSTLNLQMGCGGCELWNPVAGVKRCYAGVLTERYGGRPGWPESFDKPALFLDRLDAALRWPDLTGKPRPGKPWLDGLPRMVFLDDMGDTFTESLPLDWLAPLLPRLAASPHVWMLLTKRGRRMREFSEAHPLPANVWPGVSVTTERTLPRVAELLGVRGGGVRWLSAEPLWESLDLTAIRRTHTEGFMRPLDGRFNRLGLVILGGESGPGARPCHLDWLRSLVAQCRAAGTKVFCKQIGSVWARETGSSDTKGGKISEFPPELQIREFPNGHQER